MGARARDDRGWGGRFGWRRLIGGLMLTGLALSGFALADCGERLDLPAHDGARTPLAYLAAQPPAGEAPITLVLLPGGSGHVALDPAGCPTRLKGNWLIRAMPRFAASGFGLALVDAPTDHQDADGLGGFRTATAHAADLGMVIAELRRRTGGAVWLVGTSRGTISSVNAAARLSGPEAADGVVLTSSVIRGDASARKAWVAQSVFDLPLEQIVMPVLAVGHADDACIRSPVTQMPAMLDRVASARRQGVTVTGGPGRPLPGVDACEGKAPHGFVEQEDEVVAGIARFVRGGPY